MKGKTQQKVSKRAPVIPMVIIAGAGQTANATAYGVTVASPDATANVDDYGVTIAFERANAYGGAGAVALGMEYAYTVKTGDGGVARVIDVGRALVPRFGVTSLHATFHR